MLQAQSVFILGIYEGEYSPPPQKKNIKFFWYFGPEFSIVTKSQWLIQHRKYTVITLSVRQVALENYSYRLATILREKIKDFKVPFPDLFERGFATLDTLHDKQVRQ